MSNAHNFGIVIFGVSLFTLNHWMVSFLGLVLMSWGAAVSVYYYSFLHHTQLERKKVKRGFEQ